MRSSLLSFSMISLLVACGDPEPTQTTNEEPPSKEDIAESTQAGKADFPFDICARRGWYDDNACDWFCPRVDPVCLVQPLGPEPNGTASALPIILAHGFNAGREGVWSFHNVEGALQDDGHTVYSTEVQAFDSTENRAKLLAQQVDEILEETGADKVHMIAHSMGGLDTRYMISNLGYGDRIATLTTISTPHRGSAVADVALRLTATKPENVINALATLWSRSYNEVETEAQVRSALTSLSEKHMRSFNRDNLDDPRVHYQSWAGVSSVLGINNPRDLAACDGLMLRHPGQSDVMNKLFKATAAILAPGTSFTPNDGVVTVASAKWGNFKGCIPADHLDEVGQIRNNGPDEHTGFDHIRFYRNLAFDLAQYDR